MDHYGMEVGGVMNGHVTCAFVPIGILVWQMPKRLRLHHQSHCRHISKDAKLPKKTWTSALHTGGKIFQKRMTQRAVNEMFVVNRIMYPFLHVSGYTNIAIQRERFHMATMMSATLRDCERHMNSMRNCELSRLTGTNNFEGRLRYRQFVKCAAVEDVMEGADVAFALRVVARKAKRCERIEKREIRFHRLSIVTGTTTMTRPRFS
jgi:hypothetical protein